MHIMMPVFFAKTADSDMSSTNQYGMVYQVTRRISCGNIKTRHLRLQHYQCISTLIKPMLDTRRLHFLTVPVFRSNLEHQLNASCLGNDRWVRSAWICWTRDGGEFAVCKGRVLSETVAVLPLTLTVIALTRSLECLRLYAKKRSVQKCTINHKRWCMLISIETYKIPFSLACVASSKKPELVHSSKSVTKSNAVKPWKFLQISICTSINDGCILIQKWWTSK